MKVFTNFIDHFPYRLRYAVGIGLLMGIIVSFALLRFQPQQNGLSTNFLSSESNRGSGINSGTNLTLPFMFTGQSIRINLTFLILGTTNYTLKLGLYEIIAQNVTKIKKIDLIGSINTWDSKNTDLLGKVFSITYYFPHDDFYLLIINSSTSNAPVYWEANINVSGVNPNYNLFVYELYLLILVIIMVMLISFAYDIFSIYLNGNQIKDKTKFSHKTDNNNLDEINRVMQNFVSLSDDNITFDKNKFEKTRFFGISQSFRILLKPIIKKPTILTLLSAFMMISLTLGYLIPIFLLTSSEYLPTQNATINFLLAAPSMRLFVSVMVLIQILLSFELWIDKESGFLETILSFPITSFDYYIGKFFIQQLFTLVLTFGFFIPMIIYYTSIPSLGQLQVFEAIYFLIAIYLTVWIITGIQFILNIFFKVDSSVLGEMLIFSGWIILSIASNMKAINLLLSSSALNPFSLDSIEFLTEYLFRNNGFQVHDVLATSTLISETFVFQIFLVLLIFFILLFVTKYSDKFNHR